MEKSSVHIVECEMIHEFIDAATLSAEEREKLRQLRATGAMKAELEQCAQIQGFVERAVPAPVLRNGSTSSQSHDVSEQPKSPG